MSDTNTFQASAEQAAAQSSGDQPSAAKQAEVRTGAWSDIEKHNFLLLVVAKLLEDKSLKVSEVNFPGRSTKACTHVWQAIKQEAAELVANLAGGGDGGMAMPVKPKEPRKRKPKNSAEGESPMKK